MAKFMQAELWKTSWKPCYMSLLWHACPLKRVCEPDVPLLPQDLQPVYRMLLQVPLKIHQKQCVGHFLPFNHIWALQDLCRLQQKISFPAKDFRHPRGRSLPCKDMNHVRNISEGSYEVILIFMWCSAHLLDILRMYLVYSENEIPIP